MKVSKGQAQIITAVLLIGISITLVVGTYFLSLPLIESRKSMVKISNMETMMKTLNEKITELYKHPGKVVIPVNVVGELRVNTDEGDGTGDNISLTFKSREKMANETILVGEGDEKVAPLGSNPGMIKIFTTPMDGEYKIEMRLFYRELESASGNKYKIDLVGVGRKVVGSGKHNVIISNPDRLRRNEDLYITEIDIRLE